MRKILTKWRKNSKITMLLIERWLYLRKYIVLIMCWLFMLTTVAFATNVEKGHRGQPVKEIQLILIEKGYLKDSADGVYGSKTELAVKHFQKDHDVKVTGKVDNKTLSLLQKKESSSVSKAGKEGIGIGDRGQAVREVQERLVSSGFSPGSIDGVYGNDTARAVKRFQEHHSLPQTGVVDGKTKEFLKKDRGVPTKYKKVITMEATAYTAHDPGNGNYTARGNLLRRGLVSVDPDVIPLGTELYIEGYGYAVADDIGGAIQGHRIDLAMETRDEAFAFGRRDVQVYVLN